MAGYIGKSQGVTQVDGYTRSEADAEYANIAGDTFTGAVTGTDLTLSGGVYLGGTSSANYLDDYEEGTFTPTFSGITSGTPSYNYQQGNYIKTGAWVHCTGIIGLTNSSSLTGSIGVNVPFTPKSTTFGQSLGGAADGQGLTFPILNTYAVRFTIGNNAVARVVGVGPGGSAYQYNSTGVGNNWYFRFNFSYYTNT